MRRGGLGKGLDALIPAERGAGEGLYREVPVTSIQPSRNQPRQRFDEEGLIALAGSIAELGLLQPILVRTQGETEYEIIAGERRWRAARRAGLRSIPVLVQDVDDAGSLERALVENLHREDLNALEEAGAYQQLIEDFGLSHEALAERVGRSRSTITNMLRLFQLPPSVQRLVAEGELTAGHARALLGTPDREVQEDLARRAVVEGMSVRSLEEAVRSSTEAYVSSPQSPARGPRTAATRPAGVIELEELLSDRLSTRVSVQLTNRQRGRMVVEFANLEDLERIYRTMLGELALGTSSGDAD